jgi:hypothetical protein
LKVPPRLVKFTSQDDPNSKLTCHPSSYAITQGLLADGTQNGLFKPLIDAALVVRVTTWQDANLVISLKGGQTDTTLAFIVISSSYRKVTANF